MSLTTNSDTTLTDLCAICHVNPLKYTCPRCGIHTCSLPCVKRHKQWAQCSGVRDPAEYRKRSELATPSSIDKDFNFITKVERTIQRADAVTSDKGIDLTPARPRLLDTKTKVEQELESRNIRIIKAPKALSRSKQNKTHWAGNAACVMWTVEWIFQDGEKHINHIHESKTMGEAYKTVTSKKTHGSKRKRPHREETPNQNAPAPEQSESTYSRDPAPSESISNFYLHRPDTEARYKCLVPITSSTSLKEAFTNRTFNEFPTIYVRDESAEELKEPFIFESEYKNKYGGEIPINLTIGPEPNETEKEVEGDVEEEQGELDPNPLIANGTSNLNEAKVLEVLVKDLGG